MLCSFFLRSNVADQTVVTSSFVVHEISFLIFLFHLTARRIYARSLLLILPQDIGLSSPSGNGGMPEYWAECGDVCFVFFLFQFFPSMYRINETNVIFIYI